MSDTPSTPTKKEKKKERKKKEKKDKKGHTRTSSTTGKNGKKENGEGAGEQSTSLSNSVSNLQTSSPRGPAEPSPERKEFEALFKRILHDEIADNRLAFALSMAIFHITNDEVCALWIREYSKACEDERLGIRPPVKNPLPLRQLQFLREWLTTFRPEISAEASASVLEAMKDGRDPVAITSEFKILFLQNSSKKDGSSSEAASFPAFPKLYEIPKSVYQSILGTAESDKDELRQQVDLLANSAQNIAKQLTAIEHNLLKAIRPEELVGLTWAKHPEKAPNIFNMTAQFNRVSYWVATEIVLTSSTRDQVALIRKFVQICKECLTLNNFNTCMEILSGLNHVSVQRLKRMWEKVPSGVMSTYESLEEIMTTQQNFSKYREKLAACQPPAIPYLGVYLKDLTFIYDGNLKYTEEGRTNFDLLVLVFERWKDLRQYQEATYAGFDKIKYDTLLETLGAYDHHEEDVLYELSLQAQPSIWANRPDESDRKLSLPDSDVLLTSDDYELDDSGSKNDGSGVTSTTAKTSKLESLRTESDDAKTDTNSDELSSTSTPKEKKRKKTMDPGTESDESFLPRQKRNVAKALDAKDKDKLVTVKVPHNQMKAYLKAENIVDRYFANCYQSKKFGTIEIFDQRYLLLRAPSLSIDFVTTIHKDLEWLISQADATKFANKLLFDFAYTLGKSDAHNFSEKMMKEGKNPSLQTILMAEPITLSYLGWSFADVHKGANIDPTKPKEFLLCFDRMYSFESTAWQKTLQEDKKSKPKQAICTMSCGYTSGWCSDALGTSLLTVEVTCRAKGDSTCTFITAHSECIEEQVEKYIKENGLSRAQKKVIHYPDLNMVGKKDTKKKKNPTVKKSPKPDPKGKGAPAPEPIDPLKLPSFRPDDKTMKSIDRMQKMQMKSTKLAFSLFSQRNCDTSRGTVEVNQEPYVFLRAKAMSVEFFPLIQGLYPSGEKEAGFEFATKFLLDFGISLGKADYKHYINKMKLGQAPPIYHMLALPRILAELGWGQMDLDYKTARLTQTEKKLFLRYKLKRSAEAMAWKEERKHNKSAMEPRSPVCVMHTGYVNGYVTECFTDKADLAVVELCCEGKGDLYCEFIIAHRARIARLAAGYYQEKELALERVQSLEVLRLLDKRSKLSKKAIKADTWGF